MDDSLYVSQQGTESTTIRLTPEKGREVRSLIERTSRTRFSTYVLQVGMEQSNVLGYLSGNKKISLRNLRKLLSGIEVQVECNLEFVIKKDSGDNVKGADYQSLDDLLYLEDVDTSSEDQLKETDGTSTTEENQTQLENGHFFIPPQIVPSSSSLEKPPENKRT